MNLDLTPSKTIDAAQVASSETVPQKAVVHTPTGTANHKASEKHAAAPGAVHPKAEIVDSLLVQLKSPDSLRRATAAEALGRTANITVVPALITALRDADADVAREAATALGSLGSIVAVEPLIAILQNRDGYFHCAVRAAASHSLGQLRDVRAVAPLVDAIHDPIAEASAEAIRALATLADPRSIPALLQVVRNEHGFFLNVTRRAAVQGLAQIGGEQAACELRFVASNQWEDAVVRAAAIAAAPEGSSSTLKA